jgi:hypothetical protein
MVIEKKRKKVEILKQGLNGIHIRPVEDQVAIIYAWVQNLQETVCQ